MPTPAQIDEQIALERKAIAQGLENLRKNTRKLEEKSYASASIYGVSSIDTLLPLVVERIQSTSNRIHEGKTGVAFKEIASYLSGLEPLAAAAIACKVLFDTVFSTKDKANVLTNVASAIGKAVEDECQMRYYEREAPGLLKVIKDNYWHSSAGTQQRLTSVQILMNRQGITWKHWGSVNKVKLGGWLIDCICQVSGWFAPTDIRQGRKTTKHLFPTAEFLAIKDEVIQHSELFAPIALPMLIEPNDWDTNRQGGYLLNEVMRGHQMVRGAGGPTLLQEGGTTAFLNKIQKVAYRVNPFIYGVAQELSRARRTVGKFIADYNVPEPQRPLAADDDESIHRDWKRQMAVWHNNMQQHAKKQVRTRKQLESVEMFKDKEFYLPWSFDYRGRAYPIPAFLTPQDTDFGKSLLRFAHESFVDDVAESWLAFQVATTYGLDKAPMVERLEWVKDNLELIERVATDPIVCLPEWEAADEPWQFLAACDEYYRCCIACCSQSTGLMVATDATCSGLQILAGLARDASTARLVNVLPSDRPQDAYKVVAEAASPDCPEHIRPMMNRKVVKRVVMTVPYNAKPHSNRQYIREAFKEEFDFQIEPDDLTVVVKAVRAAMDRVVPGPMAVMKWIETEVAAAIKRGADKLSWKTPSGFIVNQRFMKQETQRIELKLLGNVKLTVATADSAKVDLNHHKSATSPNLIHSLDASLLHLSVERFDAPIALIHDSVLCRASDMSSLSEIVRETYMHLFAEHDYLKDFAAAIGAETEPPIIGDLVPEDVMQSTYFFC